MGERNHASSSPISAQNQQFPKIQTVDLRMQNDICFRCKTKGHWAKDCPSKNPPKISSQGFSSGLSNGSDFPVVYCQCGGGVCDVLTSKTAANFNRKFYRCPGRQLGKNCEFFKWYEELNSSQFEVPLCPCGAGACSVRVETNGLNSGRRYFTCRLKKGFGACKFFQWGEGSRTDATVNQIADEGRFNNRSHSTVNIHQVNNTISSDSSGKGNPSGDHVTRMKFEPSVTDKPQNLPTFVLIPPPLNKENVTMTESRDYGETSNTETLTELDDSEPVGTTEKDSFDSFNTDTPEAEKCLPIMQKAIRAYHPISVDGIPRRSPKLWIQISASRNTPSGARIKHILGWWGRIAFPPARCLAIPPPKPFFCCIFPSFDPSSIIQEANAFNARESTDLSGSPNANTIPTQQGRCQIAWPSAIAQLERSSRAPHSIKPTNIITGSIWEAFSHAALCLQNKLLTHLESMDPFDHKSMECEADSIFAALDRLFIDYTSFHDRVKNFIQCASSLTSLEQSMHDLSSQKELIEQYNSKKATFDEISHIHTDTLNAFIASDEQLSLLREEASRIKNMLIQIEKKLACCESETLLLETRVNEIYKEKLEAETSLQNAEESFEICQEREANWYVLKEEFEKARNQLFQ